MHSQRSYKKLQGQSAIFHSHRAMMKNAGKELVLCIFMSAMSVARMSRINNLHIYRQYECWQRNLSTNFWTIFSLRRTKFHCLTIVLLKYQVILTTSFKIIDFWYCSLNHNHPVCWKFTWITYKWSQINRYLQSMYLVMSKFADFYEAYKNHFTIPVFFFTEKEIKSKRAFFQPSFAFLKRYFQWENNGTEKISDFQNCVQTLFIANYFTLKFIHHLPFQ